MKLLEDARTVLQGLIKTLGGSPLHARSTVQLAVAGMHDSSRWLLQEDGMIRADYSRCDVCGGGIEGAPWRLNGRGKFCSVVCAESVADRTAED